jgi:hypothetical protein
VCELLTQQMLERLSRAPFTDEQKARLLDAFGTTKHAT